MLKAAVEGKLSRPWREAHQDQIEPASKLLGRALAERRRRWEESELEKMTAKGAMPNNAEWKQRYLEPEASDSSKMPGLPGGWTWASVEQLGEVRLGRQRSPKHQQGPFIRPYLRVANVYEDRIDLRSVLQMNFTPAEFKTYELRSGDVLLNEGQSLELVGRAAIYRGEVAGACFQNTLVRYRPYGHLSPEFALTYFRACLHNQRFQRLARWTTNMAHLGADRFARMEFPLPSLSEQVVINYIVEEQLSILGKLETHLKTNLQLAQRLRQSILEKAFRGELVPQDPNDEPASVLLERIRAERAATAKPTPTRQRKPRPRQVPAK
jgi:type I restriction enzyme S subunit